jgi:hypothetical protein
MIDRLLHHPSSPRPLAFLLACASGLLACGEPASPPGEPAPPAAPARRCLPGPGASGTVRSIDDAVKLVNALPRPVTVTCFVESLDRPLRLTATSSLISLQPAMGRRSPRVFLLGDGLVMSVVVDGKGRDLVELGQFVTGARTMKGEIAFPVAEELPPGEPYRRIRSDGMGTAGTSCRFCHPGEEPGPEVGGATAFISGAHKPNHRTVVGLDDIQRERQACDPAAEPARCELLGALLDHGQAIETAFPDEVPTFFD